MLQAIVSILSQLKSGKKFPSGEVVIKFLKIQIGFRGGKQMKMLILN